MSLDDYQREVISAAVRVVLVRLWNDEHPENPNADADDEHSGDLLDAAIYAYVSEKMKGADST